jgi:hypothetical protein
VILTIDNSCEIGWFLIGVLVEELSIKTDDARRLDHEVEQVKWTHVTSVNESISDCNNAMLSDDDVCPPTNDGKRP